MPDFDTGDPHIARVYDYWLGGKDNFAADRELAERTLQAHPNLALSVRATRARGQGPPRLRLGPAAPTPGPAHPRLG
jgi:hypothetical protein